MLILNEIRLERFWRKHRDARQWLQRWRTVVSEAEWHSIQDVRRIYALADGVTLAKQVVTVFNVKGNEYRLITRIDYTAQVVLVHEVLTHAEYDRDSWKDRI